MANKFGKKVAGTFKSLFVMKPTTTGSLVKELKRCGLYEKLKEMGVSLSPWQTTIRDADLMKIYTKLTADNGKNLAFDEARDMVTKITSFHTNMPCDIRIKLYKKAKEIADNLDNSPKKKILLDFAKNWGEETFDKKDNSNSPVVQEVLKRRKSLIPLLITDVFPIIRDQFVSKNTGIMCSNIGSNTFARYKSDEDVVVFNNMDENLLKISGKNLIRVLLHEMQHSDQCNDIGKGNKYAQNPRSQEAYRNWQKFLEERGNRDLNGFLCGASKFYPDKRLRKGRDYSNNPLEQGANYLSANIVNRLFNNKFDSLCQKVEHLSDNVERFVALVTTHRTKS